MRKFSRQIVPLEELDDYEVAAGDPDVRGWEVIAADGLRVGTVAALLVDTSARRVRYLDVDLDDDLLERAAIHAPAPEGRPAGDDLLGDVNPAPGGYDPAGQPPRQTMERGPAAERAHSHGRHVLIPIGAARIEPGTEQVRLDSLDSGQAAALPELRPGAFDPALEADLRRRFVPGAAAGADEDLYEHGLYDEDRFYGAHRGAGPAEVLLDGEEPGGEPSAGLRRDSSGLRHEGDLTPRKR